MSTEWRRWSPVTATQILQYRLKIVPECEKGVLQSEAQQTNGSEGLPTLFFALDVVELVAVHVQPYRPAKDFTKSGMKHAWDERHWVEQEDKIVVVCEEVESVGFRDQPVHPVERFQV